MTIALRYAATAILMIAAGFLLASSPDFGRCGWRLISLGLEGGGLLLLPSLFIMPPMLRGNVFATAAFIGLATLFVWAAGPMMNACRPGL